MIKGHLTICKVYSDGTQEVVVDESNIITAGLGSAFLDIQRGGGSHYALDYVPYYFQVGTSDIGYTVSPPHQASSTFFQLSAPLHWSGYGEDTDLEIVKRYRGFYASSVSMKPEDISWVELLNTSATLSSTIFSGTDQYFGVIKAGRTTKYFMEAFESEIVLDENAANGNDISEIGLFAKNPKGFKEDSPLLMAYKKFTAIPKTSDFSIVMHWNIGFLGLTSTVDRYFTGSWDEPVAIDERAADKGGRGGIDYPGPVTGGGGGGSSY
jgi:hypothetical protein